MIIRNVENSSWLVSMTDQERLELIAALDEAVEHRDGLREQSPSRFWRGMRRDLALQTGGWQDRPLDGDGK